MQSNLDTPQNAVVEQRLAIYDVERRRDCLHVHYGHRYTDFDLDDPTVPESLEREWPAYVIVKVCDADGRWRGTRFERDNHRSPAIIVEIRYHHRKRTERQGCRDLDQAQAVINARRQYTRESFTAYVLSGHYRDTGGVVTHTIRVTRFGNRRRIRRH